jgi:hypothetical protein
VPFKVENWHTNGFDLEKLPSMLGALLHEVDLALSTQSKSKYVINHFERAKETESIVIVSQKQRK